MAVLIVEPGGDEHGPRIGGVEEVLSGARVGAVVGGLEHVDGGDQAAIEECLFDHSLGAAGQHRAEPAVPHDGHDGAVVDVAVGER
jgi:hypothetical protein